MLLRTRVIIMAAALRSVAAESSQVRILSPAVHTAQHCRYIPGDAGWPEADLWSQLNLTVDGRLIATVPIGTVCHDPNYDEAKCKELTESWGTVQTQYVWLGSISPSLTTPLTSSLVCLCPLSSCRCTSRTTLAHLSHHVLKNVTWVTMPLTRSTSDLSMTSGQASVLPKSTISAW